MTETGVSRVPAVWTVYVLISEKQPGKTYIGLTSGEVLRRLEEHNTGNTVYTRGLRPWRLECSLVFMNEMTARRMERYLKEASGFRWMKAHLLGAQPV